MTTRQKLNSPVQVTTVITPPQGSDQTATPKFILGWLAISFFYNLVMLRCIFPKVRYTYIPPTFLVDSQLNRGRLHPLF